MEIPKYALEVLNDAVGRYGDLAYQFERNLEVNGDRLRADDVKAMKDRIAEYEHMAGVIQDFIYDVENK